VQGLRAAAAFSVAFTHISQDAIDPASWLSAIAGFLPWFAGVDIFFVISGFVIIHASDSLFGSGKAGLWGFLRRRLTRIAPLCRVITALFLAVLLISRKAIHGDIGTLAYIAASFLFIPWPRPDGMMQPFKFQEYGPTVFFETVAQPEQPPSQPPAPPGPSPIRPPVDPPPVELPPDHPPEVPPPTPDNPPPPLRV
jgi:hypothetical protein